MFHPSSYDTHMIVHEARHKELMRNAENVRVARQLRRSSPSRAQRLARLTAFALRWIAAHIHAQLEMQPVDVRATSTAEMQATKSS